MQISYIKISITVENIILKDYLGLKTFHTKPILNFKLASDTFILEAGLIVSISSSKFKIFDIVWYRFVFFQSH